MLKGNPSKVFIGHTAIIDLKLYIKTNWIKSSGFLFQTKKCVIPNSFKRLYGNLFQFFQIDVSTQLPQAFFLRL